MFRAGVFLLTALAASAPAAAASADPLEFFEKQVRPILAGECAMCHNEKVQSAGLDLKTAKGYLAARGAGFFGAADNPERSLLLKALGYEQRVKMPPQGRLDAGKIDVIRRWLTQGAPWPGVEQAEAVRPDDSAGRITDADRNFWAFRPLSRQAPPAVEAEQWLRTPVDRFILAKLEANGLAPAPSADKQTLLRRTTFDLTGLPPTEKEIRAFLADDSENAFANVVERLLRSPRYGERWGRHWLDVARYADSTGSDEDHRYPHAWRYRDYVIRAFNDDMPYDRFVREQLAGDILAADPAAGAGPDGIVATGFLALGKKALAQRDLVLKRYDVIDDQIDVTSKAFLGLTVSCARCHDHKFDPILQRDYYSLASIFASTHSYENGAKGRPVETPLTPPADYAAFTEAWAAILDVDAQIAKILDFDKAAQKRRNKYHADMPSTWSAPSKSMRRARTPRQRRPSAASNRPCWPNGSTISTTRRPPNWPSGARPAQTARPLPNITPSSSSRPRTSTTVISAGGATRAGVTPVPASWSARNPKSARKTTSFSTRSGSTAGRCTAPPRSRWRRSTQRSAPG